jgi:hypothetical protein
MDWGKIIEVVTPHVVRIETPTGYGTGFLAFYNHDASWCGVATAAHVVGHADEWGQPIRLRNSRSPEALLLPAADRMIFVDHTNDSAIVLFFKGKFNLPERPITLTPTDKPCGIGSDIGWLGFPNIEPNTLCFFAGSISAWQEARKAYLIDGVAINGVSGGPVFHCPNPDQVEILGCVSAYHANRATGEALPGLLRAQDVSHFHGVARAIHSVDEENEKEKLEAAKAAKEAGEPP